MFAIIYKQQNRVRIKNQETLENKIKISSKTRNLELQLTPNKPNGNGKIRFTNHHIL